MNPDSLAAWTAAFFLSSVLFSHTVALRLLLLIGGLRSFSGRRKRTRQPFYPKTALACDTR
jgi:hypothetical protein